MIRQLAEQVCPLPPEVKAFRDNNLEIRRNPTDDDQLSLLKSVRSYFLECIHLCRCLSMILLYRVSVI